MTAMPPLITPRLIIRPFVLDDLDAYCRLQQASAEGVLSPGEGVATREQCAEWLRWAAANAVQLAQLHQPPYGDRAVTLRSSGELIGACGLVPCIGPFEQIPEVAGGPVSAPLKTASAEVGLFYMISARQRRRGYASEAAHALIDYAFGELRIHRVIATTTHDNAASQRVMRRLGMQIGRNSFPDPHWLQAVGVRVNPAARPAEMSAS